MVNSRLHPSPLHQPRLITVRYVVPTQEAGNALVISLESHVSTGSGEHINSGSSCARLALDNAMKKYQLHSHHRYTF
ncbi:hypothetical protein EVAR_10014_1 [Eumeta japonica]|uniref:Uncharacterized protein n=1 Tax=Eumeta variegata TaxID=151549 RepID=A0A4C1TR23_EUMVA|nr:hypothetical protein EVAR_10014_1 [Eumeta japonica]